MGYGHQRAAMPLLPLAEEGRLIIANDYDGIPDTDYRMWHSAERLYSFVSRLKGRGWLGRMVFAAFDHFQGIPDLWNGGNQTAPTFQLRQIYRRMSEGWGRHLIEKFLAKPLPLITSYFVVAHMAEYWNYPAPVLAIVTDTDIPRAWAPLDSSASRITYLASTPWSARRLELYGVRKENIVLTGFPLPEELVGDKDKYAKEYLRRRLTRLDPQGAYRKKYAELIRKHVGTDTKKNKRGAVSITFAIGGAGAQTELAKDLFGLIELIRRGKISLNLIAGVSERAAAKFRGIVGKAGLTNLLGNGVDIVQARNKEESYRRFNEVLKTTDVLWTKPSELSFYAALGIPIVMSQSIGAHENRNREWLLENGAAMDQKNPRRADEWLWAQVESGRLAEMAMNGFLNLERRGLSNIKKALAKMTNR